MAEYSAADKARAWHRFSQDEHVRNLRDHICNLFLYTKPEAVSVEMDGSANVRLDDVGEKMLLMLRSDLQKYMNKNYPELMNSADMAQIVTFAAQDTWLDPKKQAPEKNGEFLAITDEEDCVKVTYYKTEKRWEYSSTGQKANVLLYMPKPPYSASLAGIRQ